MTIQEKTIKFNEAKSKIIKLLPISYVDQDTGHIVLYEGTHQALLEMVNLVFNPNLEGGNNGRTADETDDPSCPAGRTKT